MYRPGRENSNADALSRHPLLPAPAMLNWLKMRCRSPECAFQGELIKLTFHLPWPIRSRVCQPYLSCRLSTQPWTEEGNKSEGAIFPGIGYLCPARRRVAISH